ncbi:MAG: hypothetical protein ACK411_15255 [Exiguobacterium mexicanum]
MLTEQQLDAFFEGLLYAGMVAFITMMLLSNTPYWLVAGAVAGTLAFVAASLHIITKGSTR